MHHVPDIGEQSSEKEKCWFLRKNIGRKRKKAEIIFFPKHFCANIRLADSFVGQLDVICDAEAALKIKRLLAIL